MLGNYRNLKLCWFISFSLVSANRGLYAEEWSANGVEENSALLENVRFSWFNLLFFFRFLPKYQFYPIKEPKSTEEIHFGRTFTLAKRFTRIREVRGICTRSQSSHMKCINLINRLIEHIVPLPLINWWSWLNLFVYFGFIQLSLWSVVCGFNIFRTQNVYFLSVYF